MKRELEDLRKVREKLLEDNNKKNTFFSRIINKIFRK